MSSSGLNFAVSGAAVTSRTNTLFGRGEVTSNLPTASWISSVAIGWRIT